MSCPRDVTREIATEIIARHDPAPRFDSSTIRSNAEHSRWMVKGGQRIGHRDFAPAPPSWLTDKTRGNG
jgi:hypothetical protein